VAALIDDRLNHILDPTLPQIIHKYDEKFKVVEKCDELFDKCEEKLRGMEAEIDA
jgi:hypothetical protein